MGRASSPHLQCVCRLTAYGPCCIQYRLPGLPAAGYFYKAGQPADMPINTAFLGTAIPHCFITLWWWLRRGLLFIELSGGECWLRPKWLFLLHEFLWIVLITRVAQHIIFPIHVIEHLPIILTRNTLKNKIKIPGHCCYSAPCCIYL